MLKRIIKLLLAFAAVFTVISANRTDIHAAKDPYGSVTWTFDGEYVSYMTWRFPDGQDVIATPYISPGYANTQRIMLEMYKKEGNSYTYKASYSSDIVTYNGSIYQSKIRFPYSKFYGIGEYRIDATTQYYNSSTGVWVSSPYTTNIYIQFAKIPSPTSIKLNKSSITMKPDGSETLKATVAPSNAPQTVKWSTSDSLVATVSSTGVVEGNRAGTCTITARTVNGLTATCKVTVLSSAQISLIEDFVTRLYDKCFNRAPDSGGLKNWTDLLCSGKRTAAQVVTGFFNSKEMQNLKLSTADYIERCYIVMMDRASDAGGKKSWLDAADSGVSNTYILRGFVHSNEFTKICSKYGIERGSINVTEGRDMNLGITKFVGRCYTKALGRKYDINGLNSWCTMIAKSANQKQAAITVATDGFFHSQEFKNKNTTNEQYVTILYQTFLGRDPDAAGFKDWVSQLNRGTNRDQVLNGFAGSAEFAKIMAGYGIK